MEIRDILLNGSSYDPEYQFHNQAITLVFNEQDRERTIRANLRYYPSKNSWDINPIFYEFTEAEKEELLQKILTSKKVKLSFDTPSLIQ
jgi:hypothetical protein